MNDDLVRKPLFLVADPGTQADLVAPFVTSDQEPADPKARVFGPGTTAILEALAASEARAAERHADYLARLDTVADDATSALLATHELAAKLDRRLPEPFPGHP